MGHRIVLPEEQLDQEFENVLDEMYCKYHIHSTNIPNYNDPKASAVSNFWGVFTDEQAKLGAGNKSGDVNGLRRGSRSTEVYVAGYWQGMSGGACVFVAVFVVAFIGLILYALPIISKSLGW